MTRRDQIEMWGWIAFITVPTLLVVGFMVTHVEPEPTQKVIIQKQVVLGDEKKIIETFITQLLEPKSAKCFKALLMRESSMNSRAKNPTSSAKGVGQLLDASYKNLGMRFSDDALSQTVAALAHIGRKFGSGGPCKAWEHFKKNNWY